MAVLFSPWGNMQFVDANGNPLVGGKIMTYTATSSTPLATYTDASGTVPQSNPIILNSRGAPTLGEIWLTSGLLYKFQLFDASNNLIDTVDNISGVSGATTTNDEWVDSGVSPVYVSTSSYTAIGDQTTQLHIGRRQKFQVASGIVYGRIISSVFTTLTTVTLQMDGSQVLDGGLSSAQVSILRNNVLSLPERIASTTGTNTYSATVGASRYVIGDQYKLTFATPNDGTVAPTLNLDALGVNSILLQDGSIPYPGALNGEQTIRRTAVGFTVLDPNGSISPSVRQAIQYGPTTGTPPASALIPQSQITNTLAVGVTLKHSTATTFYSVANGFSTDGQSLNFNWITSTDVIVPNLTASSTNYIWVDVVSRTAGFVTIPDIEQGGGTISITNNQYTYDYYATKMYLGNGSAATQVNRIIVAEVDTSATAVTAIRCRAYQLKYDGDFTTPLPGVGVPLIKTSNLGTVSNIRGYLEVECLTAEFGFSVGQRIQVLAGSSSGFMNVPNFSYTRNQIRGITGNVSSFSTIDQSLATATALTSANWKWRFSARVDR